MTKLLTCDNAQEKIQWVCSFMLDSYKEKYQVSTKDIEQLLEFICDLENSDSYLEASDNLKAFILCFSSALLIKNLPELTHLTIKVPGASLVRQLTILLSKAKEDDVEYISATLCHLLCLEPMPGDQLNITERLRDSERELIKNWSDTVSDKKGSPKGTKLLVKHRESSLAYELWSEITQNSIQVQGCSDILTITTRNEFAIYCIQTFWSCNGWQHVLSNLDAIPSILVSDNVSHVHARLKTINSLSRLFLIASLGIPYIQLTNTVPTSDRLLSDDSFTYQQQMFVSIPEKIVTQWIESISKVIKSGCLWFVNYILHRELNDIFLNLKEMLDEILTNLASLYKQHLGRLLSYQISSNPLELIQCLNFETGLTMLKLFANSLPNILPADMSDLLCLIESLNQWDRQLNLVPIKPLLLKYFTRLFKLSLTLLASGDLEYYRHGSDFFFTLNSDITSSSLLPSSDDLNLTDHNIKHQLDRKFDLNEFLDRSTKCTPLSRLFILCGHHFQADFMRILTEMFNVIKEHSRRLSCNSYQQYRCKDSSENVYQDLQVDDFKFFLDCTKEGLHFLNNLLLARSNLVKVQLPSVSASIEESPSKDNLEFISIIGFYLCKMINYADETVMHESTNASCITECKFSMLDQELSHLIYAFTSCQAITECALKHLGYSLNTGCYALQEPGFAVNSTMLNVSWPLWSDSHVFCLLSGHMLSILRSTDSIIISEDSIKSFWSNLLTSVQHVIMSVWESSLGRSITVVDHRLMDIHPNLLQFACFLAGQTPGLTAKKQLLILLTQSLCNLNKTIWTKPQQSRTASIIHILSERQQITHAYYLWLRLIVMLRYMLHYFYIPPNYLSHQLKLSMFLQSNHHSEQQNKCMIWEYSTISQLASKLHPYFLPLPLTVTPVEDSNHQIPFFYDLLTSATQSSSSSNTDHSINLTVDSSSKKTGTNLGLPSPDGLAISSLASLSNYHEIFSSLANYLDSLLLTDSLNKMLPNSHLLTECCQLPLCIYGLALNWRLLEILPPPIEFLKDLHHFIGLLSITPQKTIDVQSVSRIFLSPSHFIYFIILLDRIQQNPTQPDYQFTGFGTVDSSLGKAKSESSTETSACTSTTSTTGNNANMPPVPSSRSLSSSTYTLLDSRANFLKELKRLIHTQCSSKSSSEAGESNETRFVFIDETINTLISLVHPNAVFSFLFECGSLQLKSYSPLLELFNKSLNGITVGQLSYLCSLFQFLNALTSQLAVLNESKSTKPFNATSKPLTDTVESVKRAGKHRTRHAAGKGRTCSIDTSKYHGDNSNTGTVTPKEKKSICLLDTAVLDATLQDNLPLTVPTINNTFNTGDPNLSPKEVSFTFVLIL
ncbi:E3 ubiquitin-protein ligase [Schistosoma japonicum]|nr:E3 ubiquitin-protein ligase [Schistosoma japonicum]